MTSAGGEEIISFIPTDSTEKSNTKGKVWYECILPDGRKCSTFDEKIHELLKECATENMTVRAVVKTQTKGNYTYTNFVEVRVA